MNDAKKDASATAGLLTHYISTCGNPPPWNNLLTGARHTHWPTLDRHPFTPVTRTPISRTTYREDLGLLAQLADFMPRVDTSDAADPYLAVLDQALADRYLSADENGALAALATSLGLTEVDVSRLHKDYLYALARVALADSHLSEVEDADLRRVASILGHSEGSVSAALEAASRTRVFHPTDGTLPLKSGDLVVFTGDMAEPREVWMQRAVDHGYLPHPNVTKKVRLVVAADPDSLSGKAKKARGYDIPIISVDEFRRALGYTAPDPDVGMSSSWSNSERQWAKVLREEAGY